MDRSTRPIGWVRAARKAFAAFPADVQEDMAYALAIAAAGGKADIAKPMKGLGSGVMEIALSYPGDAYRAVYVTEIAGSLWVVHAFQKKSKTGIQTPRHEIDLIRDRIRHLRAELTR